jgi:ATP dependent DNA ligase domain
MALQGGEQARHLKAEGDRHRLLQVGAGRHRRRAMVSRMLFWQPRSRGRGPWRSGQRSRATTARPGMGRNRGVANSTLSAAPIVWHGVALATRNPALPLIQGTRAKISRVPRPQVSAATRVAATQRPFALGEKSNGKHKLVQAACVSCALDHGFSPPTGDAWQFEVKFDGWRAQLHKSGVSSTIFGRNGGDLTRRFPAIAAAVLGLPTRSCVINGELIAAGGHGQPEFLALLHGRHASTCVYCFDLLELNGRDLREQPLVQRRTRLQALLRRAECDLLRFSDTWSCRDDEVRGGTRTWCMNFVPRPCMRWAIWPDHDAVMRIGSELRSGGPVLRSGAPFVVVGEGATAR